MIFFIKIICFFSYLLIIDIQLLTIVFLFRYLNKIVSKRLKKNRMRNRLSKDDLDSLFTFYGL